MRAPELSSRDEGHASIRTTMDDYGGFFDSATQAAAKRLDKIFLSKSGDNPVTGEARESGGMRL